MWIAVAALLLLGMGCSENNDDPAPGTFTGRLSGARSETLSGSAVAGTVFTEEGVSYSISLVADRGEDVFLSVSCPGEDRPEIGTHPIGGPGEECSASYRRTVVDPFTDIEGADATSGTLVLRRFETDVVFGSIEFTGPLVVGDTQTGPVTASAEFAARPIGGAPLDAAAAR